MSCKYIIEKESELIMELLVIAFPKTHLSVSITEHSSEIDINLERGPTSSEVAHFLANKGWRVQVMHGTGVRVNPEQYIKVARSRLPAGWRLPAECWHLHVKNVLLSIKQEEGCNRLRITLQVGCGLDVFDCTHLNIGQKAVQAWEGAGRPPLNPSVSASDWPFPEDEADWHAAPPSVIVANLGKTAIVQDNEPASFTW